MFLQTSLPVLLETSQQPNTRFNNHRGCTLSSSFLGLVEKKNEDLLNILGNDPSISNGLEKGWAKGSKKHDTTRATTNFLKGLKDQTVGCFPRPLQLATPNRKRTCKGVQRRHVAGLQPKSRPVHGRTKAPAVSPSGFLRAEDSASLRTVVCPELGRAGEF